MPKTETQFEPLPRKHTKKKKKSHVLGCCECVAASAADSAWQGEAESLWLAVIGAVARLLMFQEARPPRSPCHAMQWRAGDVWRVLQLRRGLKHGGWRHLYKFECGLGSSNCKAVSFIIIMHGLDWIGLDLNRFALLFNCTRSLTVAPTR